MKLKQVLTNAYYSNDLATVNRVYAFLLGKGYVYKQIKSFFLRTLDISASQFNSLFERINVEKF